jgi:cellulose synthase/poly-beta-1,6-N-acetylglucosamine synthase-like glycosyltransferase
VTVLFWLCLALVVYAYLGYPLLLFCRGGIHGKPVAKSAGHRERVSVVVAARDESERIVDRVRDLLRQDYPVPLLEIVVVSDGSQDGTAARVREMVERDDNGAAGRVKIVDYAPAAGKPTALNAGVGAAAGDVVVFADARQTFDARAVRELVSNFADPEVGCVSGELLFLEDSASQIKADMGAYWRYEKGIRKAESRSGSVVGATGAIYAVRRVLRPPLPPQTILDDVLTPLEVVLEGYRTVFDGSALAYDAVSKDIAQEWKRKVRTLAGNWQLLSLRPSLLSPLANPLWWRFLSHKVCRLLVPFVLPPLLVAAVSLDGTLYRVFGAGQVLLYGAAATGALWPAARRIRVVGICYFFVVLNAAALAGFWRWWRGDSSAAWRPSGAGRPS